MDDLGARDLVRDDSYRDGGDYFGIITPVGLLRRLVADNPIVQRATSNGYWKTRAKGRSSNMERQF